MVQRRLGPRTSHGQDPGARETIIESFPSLGS